MISGVYRRYSADLGRPAAHSLRGGSGDTGLPVDLTTYLSRNIACEGAICHVHGVRPLQLYGAPVQGAVVVGEGAARYVDSG